MTGVFDDDPTEQPRPGKGLLGIGAPAMFQEATVVVKAPVGTTLDSIPAPRPPEGEGELTPQEQNTLEACRAGMNNLHNAFWVAGKSLETMATGNLHRNEGFGSFSEFVWVSWEISESQTYRLMDEWRIGESLSQLGHRPRESQVRELADIKKTAGDRAAVAVYDAVARTGKRVTAKLLSDVTRRLPPLTPDSSPAEIGQLVRGILAPPPPASEAAASSSAQLVGDGEQRMDGTGADGSVPSITSVGGNIDSPIGESATQSSDSGGSGSGSVDLDRLRETLVLLREAARSISKPVARRALEEAPEAAQAVLVEIDDNLNRIGRAVAVRRPG
ncbi:hypothetical protein AB0919_39725 [Streptomyces sp. NPDC046994]|uniref:hypothetical protein n=1 Tax=Streptomyces sp. NPDC046994 TaxID=3155735 RepID=UPI003451E8F4